MNVSSRTRSAFLNPSSRLPKIHSSVALPIGICPAGASAKSSSVHFHTAICGGGGPAGAAPRPPRPAGAFAPAAAPAACAGAGAAPGTAPALFAGRTGRCRGSRRGGAGAGGGVGRAAPHLAPPAARGTHPDVALRARVRAAGPQAFNRIDDEGQRLELDLDRLDRERGGVLVDGGDGENRLAVIERLVRQARVRSAPWPARLHRAWRPARRPACRRR